MNSEMKSCVSLRTDSIHAAGMWPRAERGRRKGEAAPQTCISCFINAVFNHTFHKLPLCYSLSLSMRLSSFSPSSYTLFSLPSLTPLFSDSLNVLPAHSHFSLLIFGSVKLCRSLISYLETVSHCHLYLRSFTSTQFCSLSLLPPHS